MLTIKKYKETPSTWVRPNTREAWLSEVEDLSEKVRPYDRKDDPLDWDLVGALLMSTIASILVISGILPLVALFISLPFATGCAVALVFSYNESIEALEDKARTRLSLLQEKGWNERIEADMRQDDAMFAEYSELRRSEVPLLVGDAEALYSKYKKLDRSVVRKDIANTLFIGLLFIGMFCIAQAVDMQNLDVQNFYHRQNEMALNRQSDFVCEHPGKIVYDTWDTKRGLSKACLVDGVRNGSFFAARDGYVALIGAYSNGEASGRWEWFNSDGSVRRVQEIIPLESQLKK